MQRPLHLSPIAWVSAPRPWIPSAPELYDLIVLVSHDALASDDARITQPHFRSGRQPEPSLGWQLREIVAIDIQNARKWQASRPRRRILRMPWRFERFLLPVWIVFEDHSKGTQDGLRTLAPSVEILANGVLEQRHVDEAVALGHPDSLAKRSNRLRCVSAPPQARERRHPRIVPTGDTPALNKLLQLALREHGVGQGQPSELDLLRARVEGHAVEKPVVKWPMVLELERADRMSYTLDRVTVAVCEVVHRVDAPAVAGTVMVLALDPVHHWVAHVLVRRVHVDLRPQHVRSVFESAGAHPSK